MLRYDRQTKPGLVALYDIWPRNGAGQFLQPWSLHGAIISKTDYTSKKIFAVL